MEHWQPRPPTKWPTYFFVDKALTETLSQKTFSDRESKMSTLLKFHRPLFSIPYSIRMVQFGTHRFHSLFKPKRRIRCVSTSSHSQPSIGVGGEWGSPESRELWLQNTISRKKEVFRPKTEGKVGMYVCGVTAYDLSHIGHARVYVTFDVLYRSISLVFVYFLHLGFC